MSSLNKRNCIHISLSLPLPTRWRTDPKGNAHKPNWILRYYAGKNQEKLQIIYKPSSKWWLNLSGILYSMITYWESIINVKKINFNSSYNQLPTKHSWNSLRSIVELILLIRYSSIYIFLFNYFLFFLNNFIRIIVLLQ